MNEESSGNRKLMGCLITLLVVVVVVLVAVPHGLRTYVRSKMTPYQIAVIERARKPPQVPASWAQVEPLTLESRAAIAAFGSAWEKRAGLGSPVVVAPGTTPPDKRDPSQISTALKQLAQNPAPSAAERGAAADLVRRDAELVAATLALSALPDSDFDTPISAVEGAQYFAVQSATKLALISARLDALDGETSRGLATATSVLALARRHPASTLISQLIAIAVNQMATRTIADIAAPCDDSAALRAALAEMQRLDAQVNVPMPEDVSLVDTLGNLRALKREGYPVDLDFSKPATYLFDQNIDSVMRYPEWKMQQLAPNDPLRAKYAQMLASRTHSSSSVTAPSIRKILKYAGPYGDVVRDTLMSIALPNFEEASIRQKVSTARFHLTQLALAERVAQLEGAHSPAAPRDLVPKHLATEPLDPFTSAPFPRSATGDFYSPGPDGRDDQCAVTYDPTNGTLSPGDIVMRTP